MSNPSPARHTPFLVRRRRRGMSLLEVMVVIAIILTMMGVMAFGIMGVWVDAQSQTAALSMGKVAERVEIYTLRKKRPPSSSDGLAAVYGRQEQPTDPWGNPFHYTSPGPEGMPFDLVSYGEDGVEGGGDDVRWSEAK